MIDQNRTHMNIINKITITIRFNIMKDRITIIKIIKWNNNMTEMK